MSLLERMAAKLKSHQVWHVSYQQEYVPAGMSAGEATSGELWLSWPDRALFRQGDPLQRLTGLEGRRVRLVDLDVGSCEDHTLTDDEWQRTPLIAVVDPAAALRFFTLVGLAPDRLALVPRSPGGVRRVEVTVSADGLPSRVEVVDPQGAVNRFQFEAWEAASPPGAGWLPAPPAGVACTSDRGDSSANPG